MALNQLGLGMVLQATDAASGPINRVRNSLRGAKEEVGRLQDRSREGFSAMGEGARIAAVGIAGLAVLGHAADASATFSAKVAEIATLTEEATLNTEFLYDSLIDLNSAYGGGLEKQAKALYDGISAGASNAQEATALMNASNRLAVAGVTDVSVALDGLTSALNAYGVSFEKAGEFSDTFFTGVRMGKTKIEELSHVVGRVAPTASALGISFDELVASLSAVTAKGLKTEEAATSLKAAFANIIKPEGHAGAEAARLGIKFDAATVRAKGFAGLLKDITSSSKFNKDSLSKLFGSVEGLNAVLALTANGGGKFSDTLDAMKNKTGAADRAFEAMSQTVAFQKKQLVGAFENLKVVIGDALEKSAARGIATITGLFKRFTDLPVGMRTTIVQGLAAASVFAVLAGKALVVGSLLGSLVSRLAAFGSAVGAFIISPVGLAALAVTAAFVGIRAAIQRNIGGLGDQFRGAAGAIKTFAKAIQQLFTTGTLRGKLAEDFVAGGNSAVNFAVRVWLVAQRVKNAADAIGAGFNSAMTRLSPVFEAFGAALGRLRELVGGVGFDSEEMGASFDRAGEAGSFLGSTIAVISAIATGAMTAALWVVEGFASGWDAVKSSVDEAKGAFKEAWAEVKKLGEELTGAGVGGESLKGVFTTIGAALSKNFAGAIRGVANGIKDFLATFRGAAMVIGGIVDVIAGIMKGDFTQAFTGVVKVIVGVFRTLLAQMANFVAGLADTLDAAGKLVGKDIGAGASVRGLRDKMLAKFDEKTSIGAIGQQQQERAAVREAQAGAGPIVAAAQPAAADPNRELSLFSDVRSALQGIAPPSMTATLNIDGEKVAEVVMKNKSRSFGPVGPDAGGSL